MSKHTPAPWTVYPHTNGRLGCTIAFDGRGTDFTSTDICEIMPEDDNGAAIRVADANAQLIAAAPDTAEALSGLLKAFRECIGGPAFFDFEQSNPAVRAAQRALAKAGF